MIVRTSWDDVYDNFRDLAMALGRRYMNKAWWSYTTWRIL